MDNEKIDKIINIIDPVNKVCAETLSEEYGVNYDIAEALINAGYGHIPTAIREFAKRVKEIVNKYGNDYVKERRKRGADIMYCDGAIEATDYIEAQIDEIIKEYEK